MSSKKSMILMAFLVALVVLEGFLYLGIRTQYEELRTNHAQLETLYANLDLNYGSLNTSHQALLSEYDSLQSSYESLTQLYASLQTQHASLNESYNSLQESYQWLESLYSELGETLGIERTLRIGNSLESYYDAVRNEKGPESWWTVQREVDFCADLAMHDLGLVTWPTLENDYLEIAGESSYETAKQKIEEAIELTGINESDTPTEKIHKILDFIYAHISYEDEIDDVFLAPVETLGFKSGDCDDFSILSAAFFEAAGIDAAVGFFENDEREQHAMVLVHLEELTGYSYLYFSDLTGKGLEPGKWIIIEPQALIEFQSGSWIQQWNLLVAAPIEQT